MRCEDMDTCECNLPKCSFCDDTAIWELKQIGCYTIYDRYCNKHVPKEKVMELPIKEEKKVIVRPVDDAQIENELPGTVTIEEKK